MSSAARWEAARSLAASPRFTQALTEVAIAVALCLHAVRALIGWPGSIAVLAGLVALAALSLASQPERVEWRGVLPISLLGLVGFMIVSAVWSQYASATVAGIVYTLAFAFLGLYIALVRDTIQIVRAVGTALRAVLGASLVLEVLSGVLIDTPLTFLGIAGNLAQGGPIQGLAGTRNYLAFLAALAALSFWIEYRTRSVPRGLSYASLALAAVMVLFARSPVSGLVLAAAIAAGLVLVLLRRLREPARGAVQSILLVSAVVAAGLGWIFRQQVLALAGATADATIRTSVWADLEKFIGQYPAQGWGWLGAWRDDRYPFIVVRDAVGRSPTAHREAETAKAHRG